jgi:hypothetical protein
VLLVLLQVLGLMLLHATLLAWLLLLLLMLLLRPLLHLLLHLLLFLLLNWLFRTRGVLLLLHLLLGILWLLLLLLLLFEQVLDQGAVCTAPTGLSNLRVEWKPGCHSSSTTTTTTTGRPASRPACSCQDIKEHGVWST